MNDNIFRAYDIRGIYGLELTEDIAYYIGVAFGNTIKQKGKNTAIVGYDNRLSSIPLSKNLISGMADVGIDVINIGLVTTPMFYYAREYLNVPSGIVITASHSPAEYNGMKIAFDESGVIYGQIIQSLKDATRKYMDHFVKAERGIVQKTDIKDAYLQMLKEKITLGNRRLKVVVDCGNGTGSIMAVDALTNAGCNVIPIYCTNDATFPNHHPDPSIEENNATLKEKVILEQADVGLALDGDADRIGVVDEKGQMIYADALMVIILRNLMPQLNDKKALLDIKCSKALEDEIIKLGGRPIFHRTGPSYIKKTMKEENILFGGELSGHIFFADEYYGYDDGIYAGLRLLRILSNTDKPLSSLLDGMNKYYATPEIIVKATDETKFSIVEDIINYVKSKEYQAITIDGIRVLFSDGWALIRASNTGPNLTMRFEADSRERLKAIKEEFENALSIIMKKY
ncbi:MAG: phosphomannomutase/phosphoglucomutase [Bacilli bacterium]